MNIKSRIKKLTDESGFKKSFIAEKLGVSVKQLRNYESGRSYIPMDKAYLLADLLGVKVDDLYERSK
ncbi:helix-turn-helix domain-containing protein [Cytobacillus sp. FSL H8-0458]|uniref:helix-turn-helix domain-containing protein n=1 Tax=Cytobacillus sp. FSL H8-0458 TaxID=2975346 RepID=UPI0030FB7F1A